MKKIASSWWITKCCVKKIENLRNTVHVRFPANGKYPKLISNPSFVPQKHLAKI